MGRGSSRDLVRKILHSLKDGPKTVSDLATAADTTWESTKQYLESLRSAGLVIEQQDGNKRIFSLKISDRRPDVYFGLPLKPEYEKKIDSLFNKITAEWVRATGHKPNKTQMHKTFVKVVDDCNLKLPCGWYLYGKICVKHFDPEEDYEYSGFDDEQKILTSIKNTVSTYSKSQKVVDLQALQYEEMHNELYKERLSISKLLSANDFGSNIDKINENFFKLMTELPQIDDSESKEIISEFAGLISKLIRTTPKKDLPILRTLINIAFEPIWNLIAMHKFKNDLAEFYTKEELASTIELEIEFKKEIILNELSKLSDLLPPEKEPTDESYKKFASLKNADNKLDSPEKPKQIDSSNVFGELGLN